MIDDKARRHRERCRSWKKNNSAHGRAYNKAWRLRNKDRVRENTRKYRAVHRHLFNERRRMRRARAIEKDPQYWRRRHLMVEYGITIEQHDQMIAAAAGCCAICKQPARLHVDHNHATGAIRGLLCGPCNRAIGLFRDAPARMRSAAEYIEASL